MSIAYLDSSAFVKLIVREPESSDLKAFLKQWPFRASSALLRTEALRAASRHGPRPLERTRMLLRRIHLVSLTRELLDEAGVIGTTTLRTLDAIHLASASQLGEELGVILAYDDRLLAGARDLGLPTASPS